VGTSAGRSLSSVGPSPQGRARCVEDGS
jgi:hypothetical protein